MGFPRFLSSSLENSRFHWITSQRFYIYLGAIVLRIIFSAVFIDWSDGPVFLDAGNDILVKNTNIYPEDVDSPHYLFNYFPLAYLAILPGLALYYLIGLDNLYLQRLFLKLPLIVGDITLALLINRDFHNSVYPQKEIGKNVKESTTESADLRQYNIRHASQVELFVLFNPFIIFTSSIKGQFDIIPVILLYLGWVKFKNGKYTSSGALIGTSILFKQYGVLFSVMIGLNLLKTKYKKFPKFFIGHLLVAIPVLTIAAILNFEGLKYHAITYHLDRPPSGLSITSIIFYAATIFSRESYSSTFSVLVGNIVQSIFFSTLLIILLYFGYKLWQSNNELLDVNNSLLYALTGFFLFNNVFWIQYFVIFMILWIERKKLLGQSISDTSIFWSYATLPWTIVFRVSFMVPEDVQSLLGSFWVQFIWFSGVIFHFILMFIYNKQGRPMFTRPYIKPLYIIGMLILPIHLVFMLNLAEATDFFIT